MLSAQLRFLVGLCGIMAAQLALAQDKTFLGTKPDPATGVPTGASPSIMPVIQILIVAGIVVYGLKSIAPKWIGKMNKRLVTQAGGGIQIDESASFAGGTLYIVRARDRVLLLSVSTNGVQCLSDLTPVQPEPKLPVFMDMIDDSVSARGDDTSLPREFVEVEDANPIPSEPLDPAAKALDRLQRFIG